MEWNQSEVEQFLGVKASTDGAASVFTVPFPGGTLDVYVYAAEDRVQVFDRRFLTRDDQQEPLSAYVHCAKIVINRDPPEEGGNCIVLTGDGGHVCISPQDSYFAFFFSMYGKSPKLTG